MPVGSRESELALAETYLLAAIGGRHANCGLQKAEQTWGDRDARGHLMFWTFSRLAELHAEAEAPYVAATVNAAFEDALWAYFRRDQSAFNRDRVIGSLTPGQVFDRAYEHLLAVEASLA